MKRKQPPIKRFLVELRRTSHHVGNGRLVRLSMAALIVTSLMIPVMQELHTEQLYMLDAATRRLVGTTNPNLVKKFSYDAAGQQWQFNKAGLKPDLGSLSKPEEVAAQLKSQIGGGGSKDSSLYSVNLPTDGQKGIEYYDNNTNLSFTLVPQFDVRSGTEREGQLIYPIQDGAKLIYSAKNNGMKEDIVLSHNIGDSLQFTYKLNLPNTLEARLLDDGSIGVYSADQSLFGNIQFGSEADQAKVERARQTAPKDHLVFNIPAPVIKQTGSEQVKATANFALEGSELKIYANNMDSLTYPATVDPSVVVTSSSDFAAGNDEDNISFDASGSVSRGGLTGGSVAAGWTTNPTSVPTARYAFGSAAYNGYLYVMGGWGSSGILKDVQYAPINTDGTVGTWQSTTSFTTTRYGLGATAYNGYLYIMGGNSGVTNLNDVQYAPINTDGTVGTWQSTTSFTNTRRYFGTVAYDGYLYMMGGTSGTKYNDVQYAPINANGTLGTWQSTTNFSIARYGLGAVAYNNYLYIMGGYNDTSYYNDVQYAPINTDGTVGTWRSTTSFSTNRAYPGAVAYNGYLYVMGGQSGAANLNDVRYAPINANGTLGTWQSTTSFTTTRYGLGAAAYNGYLYVMGGWGTSYLSDVQYAKIDPAGIAGQYTTSSNTFTSTRRGGQTVVYNGYIYEMGGDAGGVPLNTVYMAAINSDGTLGSFSSTSAFTTARTFFAAVAYNGYMYVLGGCAVPLTSCTTSGNNVATVYKSTISSSNGTLGTWSASSMASFTTARYGFAAVAYNGYMYIMGGMSGSTFQNDIQYHAIASDGTMSGAWTTSGTSMAGSLAAFGAVVSGGNLYIAGGCSAGNLGTCTTPSQAVYSAPLSSSGGLASAFQSIGNFTNSRFGLGLVVTNSYLYVVGGAGTSGVYYGDTQYAQLTSSGTLASDTGCGASWCSTSSSLATSRYGIGTVVYQGFIYVAGGYNGSTYYNNVQYAQINNGGPGNITSWNTTTGFTTARSTQAAATYNGYIYMSGGENTGGTILSDVQYTPISSSGTVGSWLSTTSLTSAREDHAMFAYNGYLYTLGGYTSSGYINTVQYAPINSDGTLGSWTATTSFTNARSDYVALTYNNYAYILGGYGSGFYNDVQYAPINSDGTLGSWTATTSFATARDDHSAVAYNGYMYMLGGENGGLLSDVQYAPINSDGTLGSWTATTSLPTGNRAPVVVAMNGYMYVMGGYTGSYTANVYYTPIRAGGTVEAWTATTSFTTGRYYHNAVTYNGYVYILGGSSGGTYLNDVQYTTLNSIERIGHYSKLIDLGTDTKIDSISFNGSIAGGAKNIVYRTAQSDGVFGSAATIDSIAGGGVACGGGNALTRYVWVSVTIDDTTTAAFADGAGVRGTVSDITVNYEANHDGHASPDLRLRGGKYFRNESLQPLDTCGT